MDDQDLIDRIDKLVAEEHGLRERSAGQGLAEDDRDRLQKLEVALDQCWDLLRQRRGLRDRGEDPDSAEVRDPGTVEGYRQ
jgi:Rad3-related DNA helicase